MILVCNDPCIHRYSYSTILVCSEIIKGRKNKKEASASFLLEGGTAIWKFRPFILVIRPILRKVPRNLCKLWGQRAGDQRGGFTPNPTAGFIMIQCIVIEQDATSDHSLTGPLHLMNDVHLQGWFNSLQEGLAFCCQHKIDLCIIDATQLSTKLILPVSAKEESAFNPEQSFFNREESPLNWVQAFTPHTQVVLVSDHPHDALHAFEAGVLDFMMKPISFARMFYAVEKVRRLYFAHLPPPTGAQHTPSSVLLNGVGNHSLVADLLFIKTGNRVVRMRASDICYVEGLKSYVAFHLKKEKILSLMTMKEAELKLKPFQFLRIHKSYIVNVQHIQYIEKGMIQLADVSVTLPIGETYKNLIADQLKS
jgi:DNA-binding LytR/AlgR family response regulator